MAFQKGNTFVFGETPSASKWDQLWRNDDALADGSGFDPGAIGTDALAQSAVTPDKRSGGFKIGIIPGSTFGSTGNKAITGVGFRPKLVKFSVLFSNNGSIAAAGHGASDGTTQFTTAITVGSTFRSRRGSSSHCVMFIAGDGSGNIQMDASFVSNDSDGFTLNVTTADSSFDIAYEAYA